MARLKVKDGANAVDYRRSLLLSAAIAVLVTATTGARSASAQSVTGTGLNPGGTVSLPSWMVGADLHVGDSGTGSLTIQGGGKVKMTPALSAMVPAFRGRSPSRAPTPAVPPRPGSITATLLSVRTATARSTSETAGRSPM